MSERDELRDRLARELRDIAMPNLTTMWEEATDYARDIWRGKADRILADPEIARWRLIAEQEPVAWRVDAYVPEMGGWVAQNDPFNDEMEALHAAKLYRTEPGAVPVRVVSLVPLVPLTTEPGKRGENNG